MKAKNKRRYSPCHYLTERTRRQKSLRALVMLVARQVRQQKLSWKKSVEYVTDMEKIMQYGVMSMPALVVNEQVISMGKVLKVNEVETFLKKFI